MAIILTANFSGMLTKNIKLNMKYINQIFKYGLLAISSALIFSCDSDDDDVPYEVGNSLANLEESEISFFDINSTLNVSISDLSTTSGLSALEIFEGDNKLGDGTVVDDLTATFNSSLLPFNFLDESDAPTNVGVIDFLIVSTEANGEVGTSTASLGVVSPLSVTSEVNSVIYGDATLGDEGTINFETFTAGAIIDEVILSWKNGNEGTYAIVENEAVTTAGVSINLSELSYINDFGLVNQDTLYYQVMAVSGALSETVETSVTFLSQTFNDENIISLDSSSATEYLLQTGEGVEEVGEIKFEGTQGFSVLETVAGTADAEAIEGVELVKLADTGANFFAEYMDVDTARADFEAGSVIGSTQVVAGEIYVYKTRRIVEAVSNELIDVYGAILVGDVITTDVNGVATVSFDLIVKENYAIVIE